MTMTKVTDANIICGGIVWQKWSHFTFWVNSVCVKHWIPQGGTRPVAMETRTVSWVGGLKKLSNIWFEQRWWEVSVQVQPVLTLVESGTVSWQMLEVKLVVGTTWRQSVIVEKEAAANNLHSHFETVEKTDCSHFGSALWNVQMMLHLINADRQPSFVPTWWWRRFEGSQKETWAAF